MLKKTLILLISFIILCSIKCRIGCPSCNFEDGLLPSCISDIFPYEKDDLVVFVNQNSDTLQYHITMAEIDEYIFQPGSGAIDEECCDALPAETMQLEIKRDSTSRFWAQIFKSGCFFSFYTHIGGVGDSFKYPDCKISNAAEKVIHLDSLEIVGKKFYNLMEIRDTSGGNFQFYYGQKNGGILGFSNDMEEWRLQ